MKLRNKIAVITGGAHGIGRALVHGFIEQGSRVLVLDNDEEGLVRLKDEIGGENVYTHTIDIGDETAIQSLLENELFLKQDILINNAGIDLPFSPQMRGNWDLVMRVNLTGTKNVTETALDCMLQSKRPGSIIFITSVHTAVAFKGGGAYDASKHALVGYMRTIALTYGVHGIRANAISPGAIYPTKITEGITEVLQSELSKVIPLRRFGRPEEIVPLAVLLASEAGSYVSGAEIRVDGGLSIQSAFQEPDL